MENNASSSLIGLIDNSCSDVENDDYEENENEDREVIKDKRGIFVGGVAQWRTCSTWMLRYPRSIPVLEKKIFDFLH